MVRLYKYAIVGALETCSLDDLRLVARALGKSDRSLAQFKVPGISKFIASQLPLGEVYALEERLRGNDELLGCVLNLFNCDDLAEIPDKIKDMYKQRLGDDRAREARSLMTPSRLERLDDVAEIEEVEDALPRPVETPRPAPSVLRLPNPFERPFRSPDITYVPRPGLRPVPLLVPRRLPIGMPVPRSGSPPAVLTRVVTSVPRVEHDSRRMEEETRRMEQIVAGRRRISELISAIRENTRTNVDSDDSDDDTEFMRAAMESMYISQPRPTVRVDPSLQAVVDSAPVEPCDEGACTICVTNKKNIVLGCGHMFCPECVKTVLTTQCKCPNCRSHITTVIRLYDN